MSGLWRAGALPDGLWRTRTGGDGRRCTTSGARSRRAFDGVWAGGLLSGRGRASGKQRAAVGRHYVVAGAGGRSVDPSVRRLVRWWVGASIGRVGKRAVRRAVGSVRAAAASDVRWVMGGSERRDTRCGGDRLSLAGEGGREQDSRGGRWSVAGGGRWVALRGAYTCVLSRSCDVAACKCCLCQRWCCYEGCVFFFDCSGALGNKPVGTVTGKHRSFRAFDVCGSPTVYTRLGRASPKLALPPCLSSQAGGWRVRPRTCCRSTGSRALTTWFPRSSEHPCG